MKVSEDRAVQICAALVIAIGIAIAYSTSRDSGEHAKQQVPERHAARKHPDDATCKPLPCVELPQACFMHGGAPTAPECLRD